jgi:phosphopantothenoylcysteine decarboxylase/phosphopantothenate--cysteine ligase
MSLNKRKLVVVVSGGIAAYKSADLVSRLRKAGAEVRVVMTEAARQFVAPLTFETLSGHPVYEHVFDRPASWEMEHISWAHWADGIVVAPATANLLAKLALGLADDAASTLLLAWQGPLWIAPAMNTAMLMHPATQQNLETLQHRGVHMIAPGSGMLACGDVGPGRMAEPEEIVAQVVAQLDAAPRLSSANAGSEALQEVLAHGIDLTIDATKQGSLVGKTVLVTTGPTREALDPIRYLSNRSTGQMGCELASEAQRRGARVILVHGALGVALPAGCQAVPIDSARELLAAVQAHWGEVDIACFVAAVANYESAQAAGDKIKGGETLTLQLRRTPDIAAWCGAHRRPGQLLIGFCAESQNLLETAQRKLEAKGLDFICANPIGQPGIGFASAENQITLLGRGGEKIELPRAPKRQIAAAIWDATLAGCATPVGQ